MTGLRTPNLRVTIAAIFFLTILASCSQDQVASFRFLSDPVIQQNPNPAVPLAALLSFQSEGASRATVRLDDGERQWSIEFDRVPTSERPLAILGMRADKNFDITVTIEDENGNTVASDQVLKYRTPPLSVDRYEMPDYAINVSKPDRMEPGITIVQLRRWPLMRPQQMTPAQRNFVRDFGMLLGFDAEGDIVWYYKPDHALGGIERLDNGNILFLSSSAGGVFEIDMLGNTVNHWYAKNHVQRLRTNSTAIPLEGVEYLHHQPNTAREDTFLSFSVEARRIPDWYVNEQDPDLRKEQLVIGDIIIEFNRKGEIVWSWNAFDYLDVYQIGYEAFDPFWSLRGFPDGKDWTHGNGLSYDARDDSVIASFKLLDAIVKIDRKSKEIRWILGDPAGWKGELRQKLLTPVGEDFHWFYHQHNPRWTDAGTMLVFNNNRGQTKPFDGNPQVPPEDTYSYTIEYEIDEANRTVRTAWVSEPEMGPDSCNSFIMSESRRLPVTGNVLEVNGMCVPAGVENATWDAWDLNSRFIEEFPHGGRIREYSRSDPAEIVFELRFYDPYEIIAWQNFGGMKVRSLYPVSTSD